MLNDYYFTQVVGTKVLIISFVNPHAYAELGLVQIKAVPLPDIVNLIDITLTYHHTLYTGIT